MNEGTIKEQKFSVILMYLGFTTLICFAATKLITTSPVANLMKEFGIPAVAASGLLWYLEAGSTVATIAGIVSGLASGGLSLVAAAGKQTLKAFLKKEYKKRGSRAFKAW